ncbi:MAG: ABC transporter ATP-binding protein/permease [Lachnospiraceae bacterium]|nr:ABC transporter ATP-binding protein/permease [Lachnospiraceae bacterium]
MNKESTKKFNRVSMIAYFIKGSKRFFALGVFLSLSAAFLDMINPKLVQFTVDEILKEEADAPSYVMEGIRLLGGREYLQSHLYIIAGLVILTALAAAVCRYLYRLINCMGAEKLIKAIRDKLFVHIEHLPGSWYQKNHTGDILQRCTSDVETVKMFVSEQMTALFRVGMLIVLAMYFMVGINYKLALVSAAFIPVVVLYSLFFHNRISSSFRVADEEEGRLSAIAQENLTGVRVVRAFGRESFERERFEKQNAGYTKMWIRLMAWLSAFWCSNDLITGLQIMLIIVLGAVSCVRGELTPGGYIAVISYNGMLAWPVRELGRVISDMSKAGVAVDRIMYICNSPTEDEAYPAGDKKITGGDIVFKNVSFSYEDDREVLKDINLTIKEGSTLGIIGATGSGKSTLAALINRIYELPENGGSISVGGVDIRDADRKELREHISMVLQEPYLFSRTLKENISIAAENAEDSELEDAVETAQLKTTIEKFKDGYRTFVGERGVTLSGGQKQRTAIAQVVINDAPVMIFDDSLSAVDMETDAKIRRALKEKTKGKTLILISHRIATVQEADEIIVMDKGRIAERGTHDELLKLNGIYREIYEIQQG